MKSKLVLFTLFLLTLTSQAFAFSVSYDQKVSVESNVVANIKVVVKEENMWAESDFGGFKTVLLRNDKGTFSYIPEQKVATKIPAAMDRPNLTRDLPHFMEFLKTNKAEKVGSEKVDGKDCDIYKFMEPTVQQEAKAWVWTEKQFPVKIEVPAPEGLTVVELYNIQFDPKVEANTFVLPEDVRIMDMEAMQQNAAPEGLEAAVAKTIQEG
jgi:outer membrane lipoprotein-sorting protein